MASEERTFRPDIEGLRAVAVGLVVLGHAGVPGLEGGYVGVDVFFVLSGFLITGLLLRERTETGSTSLVAFYGRRARRILPAATVVLVVTVLAAYHWLGFLRGNTVADDGKWTVAFAANLHFAAEGTQYLNALAPPSPLQHYWSLAVEEQFYLVWPVLFLAVAALSRGQGLEAKLGGTLAAIIVASFTWSVIQTNSNVTWAFFSPFTRAWELAIGGLLAVGAGQLRACPGSLAPWLSWGGLAGISAGAVLFDGSTAFPGYAAALPVLATAALVAGGTVLPRAGAERVLQLPPFQALGKWSYALYLWHWPILLIAAQHEGHSLSVERSLALVGGAVCLAAVTHYALENPVRHARVLAQRPWSSVSVGASLTVAAFAVCAWQAGQHAAGRPVTASLAAAHTTNNGTGSPSTDGTAAVDPIEAVARLLVSSEGLTGIPADLDPGLERAVWDFAWLEPAIQPCMIDAKSTESPPCVFGDAAGSQTLVLLGDSHAAQWVQAFDAIGKELHWRVVLLAKTACPAVSVRFSRAYGVGPGSLVGPYPECGRWLSNAITRINQTNPDMVILASCNGCDYMVDSDGDPLTRTAWAEGLAATLNRITAPTTRKVVLGDIPRWPGALDCLATNENNVRACARPRAAATAPTFNDAESLAASQSGALFVDVVPWFCSATCPAIAGNMVVYTNDYHVTATYALHLAGALESVFREIVAGQLRAGSAPHPEGGTLGAR